MQHTHSPTEAKTHNHRLETDTHYIDTPSHTKAHEDKLTKAAERTLTQCQHRSVHTHTHTHTHTQAHPAAQPGQSHTRDMKAQSHRQAPETVCVHTLHHARRQRCTHDANTASHRQASNTHGATYAQRHTQTHSPTGWGWVGWSGHSEITPLWGPNAPATTCPAVCPSTHLWTPQAWTCVRRPALNRACLCSGSLLSLLPQLSVRPLSPNISIS